MLDNGVITSLPSGVVSLCQEVITTAASRRLSKIINSTITSEINHFLNRMSWLFYLFINHNEMRI